MSDAWAYVVVAVVSVFFYVLRRRSRLRHERVMRQYALWAERVGP